MRDSGCGTAEQLRFRIYSSFRALNWRVTLSPLLLGLLTLSACEQAERPLIETVLAYNTLLAEGYRHQEMAPLSKAATPEQVAKVYHHMAALAEGGIRMDALLRGLEFIAIQRQGNGQAQLTTKEGWSYRYLTPTGPNTSEEQQVNYTISYHLQKSSDRWLVSEVSIQESDRKLREDTLPFFTRPADRPFDATPGGRP